MTFCKPVQLPACADGTDIITKQRAMNGFSLLWKTQHKKCAKTKYGFEMNKYPRYTTNGSSKFEMVTKINHLGSSVNYFNDISHTIKKNILTANKYCIMN